jgi:hypothetical protein
VSCGADNEQTLIPKLREKGNDILEWNAKRQFEQLHAQDHVRRELQRGDHFAGVGW